MATKVFDISPFTQRSSWTVTEKNINGDVFLSYDTPSTSKVTINIDLSSMQSNWVLDGAVLTGSFTSPWTGADIRTVNDAAFTGSKNLLSILQAMGGKYGTLALVFRFKANGGAGAVGERSASTTYSNLKLTVTYHVPYTACGAPTTAVVSPSITENDPELTFSGATGGVENAIEDYEVQYADGSDSVVWGSWKALKIVLSSGVTLAKPERGVYRKYQIRARGSAGEAYYSAWKETIPIRRNRVPATPTVTVPTDGSTIYKVNPYVALRLGEEPDSQPQFAQISIDNGDPQVFGTGLTSAGGTVSGLLQDLSYGSHVIKCCAVDSLGATSDEITRNFTIVAPTWSRGISEGNIISPSGVSHKDEISQMRDRVNQIRAYYGLAPITLPGTIGRFVYWLPQMQAMQAGLGVCYTASGRAAPAWIVPANNKPRADIINQLRAAIADA